MAEDFLTRTPPQNIEAEQAVIGAILVENAMFEAVAAILETEDFYREPHRAIWQAFCALAAAKKPLDVVTLAEALRPRLSEIGGAAYFAECAAAVPAPSLALDYARIVREKAIQRRLATVATWIATQAYDAPQPWMPEWTEELLSVAEYDIAQIASRIVRKPEPNKTETLSTILWKLEHNESDSIPTGFAGLDRSFGGFNVGHLTMLAARTSRGKTAIATNIAINAARAGYPTAYFTLEMTAEEMWLRVLGREAEADTFWLRRDNHRECERAEREEQKARLRAARADIEHLPLEILYRPSMRPRDMRLECRRLAREMGAPLKLAIVDYLGLMRGDRHEKERWREMQEVVLTMKALAGELGIPMILLSQLNRETDEKQPPTLANLRDTGATEEHASNVLFIWQKPPEKGAAPIVSCDGWEDLEVIIGKQRNGPANISVGMRFNKRWGGFADR